MGGRWKICTGGGEDFCGFKLFRRNMILRTHGEWVYVSGSLLFIVWDCILVT